MRRQSFGIATLALFAALATPGAATAAPTPTGKITGTLDAPGMTVLAVAPNGTTTSGTASASGAFSVPAKGIVTLHLRAADGTYAGPVVLANLGRTATVMGVRAGTRLGKVDVRNGYARVLSKPAPKRLAPQLAARAAKGVPLGAGKLGLVKLPKAKLKLTAAGQDADGDGVVNAFDVDDDGDLRLDNIDPLATAGGPAPKPKSGSLPSKEERKVTVFSNLKLALEASLNANAGIGSMSKEAVNAAMSASQTLAISVVPGDEVELDCGGLSYCSSGGTGRGLVASASGGTSFPTDYDADGDGFGTIEKGPTGDFQLQTGANFDQIGSGDLFIERVTAGSRSLTTAPGMLNYAFTSVPAVTMFSDGSVNTTVSYPVAAGSPGTAGAPAEARANADGDVVLTFTIWRPQRPRIAPFEAKWVDIGGLGYSVDVPNAPSGGGTAPGTCAAATLSESDASLTPDGDQLLDSAADRAADPANTLTFSVNMTDCLGSGASWDVGETLNFDIQARTKDGDNAAQKLNFIRVS